MDEIQTKKNCLLELNLFEAQGFTKIAALNARNALKNMKQRKNVWDKTGISTLKSAADAKCNVIEFRFWKQRRRLLSSLELMTVLENILRRYIPMQKIPFHM